MAGVIFTELDLSVDADADTNADADAELKHGCQEPPHTWRTSSIILRFLMMIMMVGIIFIELDFA